MRKTGQEKKGRSKMWIWIYIGAFLVSFIGSAILKVTWQPAWSKEFKTDWNDSVGTLHSDYSYGEGKEETYDLYLPADHDQKAYGLVVYLHAGGFTAGDKTDDKQTLEWLCSKGYVAAGINYTLRTEENPQSSVYSQSEEIKKAIPEVIKKAAELGYPIDAMAIGGGSAGGALALIYAYRDADTSPVPVKLVFEGVGPAGFNREDWGIYGLDKSAKAASDLFSVMSGQLITEKEIEDGSYLQKVKPISAVDWVNKNTVPSVLIYAAHDKVEPYKASLRLKEALEKNGVDFKYFDAEHSGHGLQNDNKVYKEYMETVEEYLNKYLPVHQ